MESSEPEIFDVVGIGFGPSNLSLAVALEESLDPVTSAFFERQPSLGWHRGMLLPSAKMQVSFLKDLATFRNPTSKFSFISYLHDVGRLARFVNNQDFFPTRREFHDYLEWAESKLAQPVAYSSEVTAITLAPTGGQGAADRLLVQVRDPAGGSRQVHARNVVISTGLVPRMPVGVEADEFVWHSSQFLHNFRQRDHGELKRVAVVGGGQSAAEIVRFLYDSLPGATVSAIVPSYGYSVADDTPFANQVFDPDAVDSYYHGSQRSKDAVWQYHRNTNYSVVDDEVITGLYERSYEDEFSKSNRLGFLNLARVVDVKRVGGDTRVTVHSMVTEESYDLDVDLLVCATGYDPMDPAEILGELDTYCAHDAEGRHLVGRDYRLVTTPELNCGIYLQGGTEHTHGLASSLLSNIAVRSGDIAHSIVARRSGAQGKGIDA
ncbi:lysine N(6)-hydroxylase/L-ornithine N(5)-oxygenase family protein [Streptomyces sp. MBT53]|uniref:lysine N(6)-hydroxylase/L-ornithine N(5)-oxygenase family protein n=1 Tax=Streptomyces sp. MBT53 TaxID=1488384 RepID=UPI0019135B05|nr:SidA/IucD/PvdA family monooxygenase [Streptomyces sp. MBT53]MBK6016195.1 lysine N(6)-hydroxylase/L-ornithine N(5)-oxygenase family protein [Streptomyces sp. MBT53]